MTKYLSLLKVLFVQQFRQKPTTNSKKKKGKGGTVALIVVLALCFAPILIMIAALMYGLGTFMISEFPQGEYSESIIAFILIIAQGLVLLFGMPSMITNIFAPKDGDKLLYLPIGTPGIFSAKLSLVYINEVITSAILLLVTLLPFGIGYGVGALYYCMIPIAMLLTPILPLMVGSILALPISAIVRKLAKSGIAKGIVQVLLFIVFMGLYMWFIASITSATGGAEAGDDLAIIMNLIIGVIQQVDVLMQWVLPNIMLAMAMLATSAGFFFGNFAGALGIDAVLFILVLLIALPFYKKTLSSQQEGSQGKKVKLANLKYDKEQRGIIPTLMISDIKRVVRDSSMGFQMLLSVIMMPLIVVIMGIAFKSTAGDASDDIFALPGAMFIIPLVLFGYMTLLGGGTNAIGLYPISRERKSFYMLKVMPIPFDKLMLAKVGLSTFLLTIANFVCAITAMLMFKVSWYVTIFMFVSMTAFQFGSMCITSYFDIKKPILDWTSFNASLKNAKNSFIGMLCGLLSMILIGGISVIFGVWYFASFAVWIEIVMWVAMMVIGVAYSAVTFSILKNKGQQAFNKIEV